MLPLPSTVAHSVPIVMLRYAVPLPMVAQPPRMPWVFAVVVLIAPEPPFCVGGTTTRIPPAWSVSVPNVMFALPPDPLFARMIAGPIVMVVPLNVCELAVLAFPFIVSASKLAAPKPAVPPPRVSAEALEITLFAGAFAGPKSRVSVPFSITVGPT